MSRHPHDPRSRPARGTGELLVTGATGLVGRHLCKLLGEAKRRHRALVRVSSNRDVLAGSGAWMIEGDLERAESLADPLEDVKQVAHLAGLVRNNDAERNHAVHVQGTKNLIEQAVTAGVERIVALSSDTVLRTHRSPYAESKLRAEELLLEAHAAGRIEVVVLRPPMILGPGSPHLESLRRLARMPIVPMPAGAGRRAPVWVGDVADAVLAALELPSDDVPHRPIDLPGRLVVPMPTLIRAVARAEGRRMPRVISVPQGALMGAARIAALLPGQTEFDPERLAGLSEEVYPDGKMARHRLRWKPLELEEILARSLATS